MSFLSYKSTGPGADCLGSDPNSTAHQLGELQK